MNTATHKAWQHYLDLADELEGHARRCRRQAREEREQGRKLLADISQSFAEHYEGRAATARSQAAFLGGQTRSA